MSCSTCQALTVERERRVKEWIVALDRFNEVANTDDAWLYEERHSKAQEARMESELAWQELERHKRSHQEGNA